MNWIKIRLSFTINRISQQHWSIRVTQNHLRPNQKKLTRHIQRNNQHSKENKPIEFRRCQRYSSIFFSIGDVAFLSHVLRLSPSRNACCSPLPTVILLGSKTWIIKLAYDVQRPLYISWINFSALGLSTKIGPNAHLLFPF